MKRTIKFAGFTLIELLIVIGLLAALASVLLPSLMGTRDDALEGIDSYNQAGTLRTLRQYEGMTGKLPTGFHTGLQDNVPASTDDALMDGFAPAFKNNFGRSTDVQLLTSGEAKALSKIGIAELAYGEGDPSSADKATSMGYIPVSASSYVITVGDTWTAEGDDYIAGDPDSGRLFSFNGKGIATLKDEGYSKVIALFLTSTVDWERNESTGWVKGFSVKMEIPGSCPIPQTDFAYYVAYVGVKAPGYDVTYTYNSTGSSTEIAVPATFKKYFVGTAEPSGANDLGSAGSDWTFDPATKTLTFDDNTDTSVYDVTFTERKDGVAKLLGTSCPECGITNP
jgi:prepilin-type N-terminal cleavage/methylation domain-containing protein